MRVTPSRSPQTVPWPLRSLLSLPPLLPKQPVCRPPETGHCPWQRRTSSAPFHSFANWCHNWKSFAPNRAANRQIAINWALTIAGTQWILTAPSITAPWIHLKQRYNHPCCRTRRIGIYSVEQYLKSDAHSICWRTLPSQNCCIPHPTLIASTSSFARGGDQVPIAHFCCTSILFIRCLMFCQSVNVLTMAMDHCCRK